MLSKFRNKLSECSSKTSRKLKTTADTSIKTILPASLYNRLTEHFSDEYPLYRRKLKNHLPNNLKTKIPSAIWEIIAEYCFFLDCLRCPLTGELLRIPVIFRNHHIPMLGFVYDDNYMQRLIKIQVPENIRRLGFDEPKDVRVRCNDYSDANANSYYNWFSKWYDQDVYWRRIARYRGVSFTPLGFNNLDLSFVRSLIEFSLQESHRTLSLINDQTNQGLKSLFAILKEVRDERNTINIAEELRLALEKAQLAGESEFHLVKFLHQYEYPVMLADKHRIFTDCDNDSIGFYILRAGGLFVCFLILLVYCTVIEHFAKLKGTYENRFLSELIGDYPALMMGIGGLAHTSEMIFSFLAFALRTPEEEIPQEGPTYHKIPLLAYRDLQAVKASLPASRVSDLLKWTVVCSQMFYMTYPEWVMNFIWLGSGITDITCRKTVAECKELIRHPARLVTGSARNEYGFFSQSQLQIQAKRWGRFSYAVFVGWSVYVVTQNPLWTLLAVVSAIQASTLPDVINPVRSNRFELAMNKASAEGEVGVSDVKLVLARR